MTFALARERLSGKLVAVAAKAHLSPLPLTLALTPNPNPNPNQARLSSGVVTQPVGFKVAGLGVLRAHISPISPPHLP